MRDACARPDLMHVDLDSRLIHGISRAYICARVYFYKSPYKAHTKYGVPVKPSMLTHHLFSSLAFALKIKPASTLRSQGSNRIVVSVF